MDSLTQILEEELENSFEVKDRKALHRSVILLVENLVGREKHQTEFHTLQKDIGNVKDELKTDMSSLRDELKTDMNDLKDELKGDMASLRNELKDDMVQFKDEMKSELTGFQNAIKSDTADLRSDVKVLEKTMIQGFSDIDKRLAESHQSQRRVTSFLSIIFIVFGVLISVFEFIR